MVNYYAVKKGKIPGIYLTWKECEKNVNGYSMAKYKKFESKEEAEEYLLKEEEKDSITNFYELDCMKKYIKEDEKLKYVLDKKVDKEELEEYKKIMNEYKPNEYEIKKKVNVEKINNLWKKDVEYYISEKYEEILEKNKYLQSRKDLIKKEVKELPKIIYNKEKDLISFINGRHIFSN